MCHSARPKTRLETSVLRKDTGVLSCGKPSGMVSLPLRSRRIRIQARLVACCAGLSPCGAQSNKGQQMPKRIYKTTIAAVLVALAFVAPASATKPMPVERTQQEISQLERAVENGDAKASIELGEHYAAFLSQDPIGNYRKARHWFRKAYDLNPKHTEAAYRLGALEDATGHDREAIEWYEIAYQGGERSYKGAAALSLVFVYRRLQDYHKVIEWLEVLYKDGESKNALDVIGSVYAGELGDYPKAIAWYEKSYGAGYADSALSLGHLYLRLKNYPKALEWFQRSFDKHKDYQGLYQIAQMHRFGLGVKRDTAKARALLQQAARAGVLGSEADLIQLDREASIFNE
jgi:TPR repeat protein